MSREITLHERLETIEQQASYMADFLRSFIDGTITDGERRDAEELLEEYERELNQYAEDD